MNPTSTSPSPTSSVSTPDPSPSGGALSLMSARRPWRRRTAAVAAALALAATMAACGGGSDSTPKLALGTEAVVAFITPASGDTPAVDTMIGVTVLAVRRGTQQELADNGLQVDPADQDTTPYYVDVRYANRGSGAAVRNLSVGMEDTKGNSIPTTLVFNYGTPFTPCVDVDPAPLAPGESYESCTLFLVPKGAELSVVRFVSQSPDATITFTDWAVK